MTTTRQTASGWIRFLRWVARSIGLCVAALFVFFIFDSGARLVPALPWSDPQGMPLFLVLLVAVGGLLLAWRHEAVGGLLAVAGGLLILCLVFLGSGPTMLLAALLFTLPLLVGGCLYLGCWGSQPEQYQQQT